jgi:hypothetical protein
MKYVKLGRTGFNISELGFGCIPIIRLSRGDAVKFHRHVLSRDSPILKVNYVLFEKPMKLKQA